jgi:hypothetical protein
MVDIKTNSIIILKGKSSKGKQRIKIWGERWVVIRIISGRIGVVAKTDSSTGFIADSFRWLDTPEDSDMSIVH